MEGETDLRIQSTETREGTADEEEEGEAVVGRWVSWGKGGLRLSVVMRKGRRPEKEDFIPPLSEIKEQLRSPELFVD